MLLGDLTARKGTISVHLVATIRASKATEVTVPAGVQWLDRQHSKVGLLFNGWLHSAFLHHEADHTLVWGGRLKVLRTLTLPDVFYLSALN